MFYKSNVQISIHLQRKQQRSPQNSSLQKLEENGENSLSIYERNDEAPQDSGTSACTASGKYRFSSPNRSPT
ncbi:hypothetical protein V6N12_005199 [Hibiscus sabdariffa]|uniref:Uncharacterized protein n=1 Tax=Hibiscus sabdariffa TaxID=183260 RepID=A0ABR2CNS1_9ROSI